MLDAIPAPIPARTNRCEYFLGISGGHTRSIGLLVADSCEVVSLVSSAVGINPHAYSDEVLEGAIRRTIDEVLVESKIPEQSICSMGLSIAGAARPAETAKIRDAVQECGCQIAPQKVLVMDDTIAGLAAGLLPFGEDAGICAFAGTGASVFVGSSQTKGTDSVKLDGWGPMLGDHGSAFNIVLRALRAACRQHDAGRQAPPWLERVIADDSSLGTIDDLQSWFDALCQSEKSNKASSWHIEAAKKAQRLGELADEGEPEVLSHVMAAAKDMAQTILIARSLWPEDDIAPRLVFQGGVFENCLSYRNEVLRLTDSAPWAGRTVSRFRPVVGALALARKQTSKEFGAIDFERLENSGSPARLVGESGTDMEPDRRMEPARGSSG